MQINAVGNEIVNLCLYYRVSASIDTNAGFIYKFRRHIIANHRSLGQTSHHIECRHGMRGEAQFGQMRLKFFQQSFEQGFFKRQ